MGTNGLPEGGSPNTRTGHLADEATADEAIDATDVEVDIEATADEDAGEDLDAISPNTRTGH